MTHSTPFRLWLALGLWLALAVSALAQAASAPIKWRVLAEGRDSSVARLETRVFYLQNDFDNFYRRTFGTAAPTGINWQREHVVGVFLGKGTANRVMITSIDRQGPGGLRVLYTVSEPPPRRPQPRGETRPPAELPQQSPFSLATVERTAGNFTFVRATTPAFTGGRPGYGRPPFMPRPCTCASGWNCDGSCGLLYPIAVPYEVIQSGQRSALNWAGTRYLDNWDAFQRYWADLTGNPREPAPSNIDFRTDAVLAIHLGQRMSGGYGIRLLDFTYGADWRALLRWVEVQPPFGSLETQAITSPYLILRFPRAVGLPISTKVLGTHYR